MIRAGFTPLRTLRAFMSHAYQRIIEVLQKISAGGVGAEDRVRAFKLARDLAGDAFGMRAMQYGRYNAGDSVRLLAGAPDVR